MRHCCVRGRAVGAPESITDALRRKTKTSYLYRQSHRSSLFGEELGTTNLINFFPLVFVCVRAL